MRRWQFALLVVILLSGLKAGVGAQSWILVLNKTDNTAALVDPTTFEVVASVPTGEAPHEAAAAPDGKFVYTANYGRQAAGNTLTVVDVSARKVARTISLGEFKRPHGIRVSHDSKTVWVTCEASQAVVGIDAASGRVVETYRTGQETSHMLVPSKDEQKLYVANIGSGSVTIIDRKTGQVKSLHSDAGSEGIDISPDGKFVWIANRAANTISILDTASDTIVATVKAGGETPIRIKFTPDGQYALVSNARSGTVSIFDAGRREEIGKIETGAALVGILIVPGSTRAIVANTQSNQLTLIDWKERKVVRTFRTGTEPDGMAWVP